MIISNFLQPGCVNTTEVDIKKACRMSKPGTAATVKPTVNKVSKRSRIKDIKRYLTSNGSLMGLLIHMRSTDRDARDKSILSSQATAKMVYNFETQRRLT